MHWSSDTVGGLLEVVAVMSRGQTLVKSTPPPLGARGGLKTQVRTIVGVPRVQSRENRPITTTLVKVVSNRQDRQKH